MPEMMGLEMLQEQLKDVVSITNFPHCNPFNDSFKTKSKILIFNNPINVRTFMDV